MQDFRRRTPEELLQAIQERSRGKLLIYLGAFSGSGKTFRMLQEGSDMLRRGKDVVYCAVSAGQNPDTERQLAEMEEVRSISWLKDGEERFDLDVEAIAARKPELVLTDELAHRNRPGAPRLSRLEDVRELLSLGISVMVTANMYELDSGSKLAQGVMKLETRDTVPDEVLELADEVRLIDVTPEMLLKRRSDGLIGKSHPYAFTDLTGLNHLGVLREMTLLLLAEGVGESLQRYRKEAGLQGPAGTGEHILVATQYHWNGSLYVGRGHQIARRLNGKLSVVTFVKKGRSLEREAKSYGQELRKLCKKLGASFQELSFHSRRQLPGKLLDYARSQNVTRIVLGHSRHTSWQEKWQGSILDKVIARAVGIDVFIVADRAGWKVERRLPLQQGGSLAHQKGGRRLDDMMATSKPSRARKIQSSGRFKIYLGSAPGVGKTYAMLHEGNALLSAGVDAVIGLLETHGRKETEEQVGKLGKVPLLSMEYRGTTLKEMDLDTLMKLKPEVVLVDELAHTNAPGSIYKKRYESVQALLRAGISVISTMNVQHVESLNDAVASATGVRVRETVPDSVLSGADEIVLIDVSPQMLQERMREGKIYSMDKVEQALRHFFQTVNLIALRELALRELAQDVDDRLEDWEQGGWKNRRSGELVGVFISMDSSSESLIRRGYRIAHRLSAAWYAVYIESAASQKSVDSTRIKEIRALVERLGGHLLILQASGRWSIGQDIVKEAIRLSCTQLVLGQPKRHRKQGWFRGSILKEVLAGSRGMDVLVVAKSVTAPL